MTLVIASRQDMGRVTRLISAHPDWRYCTHAGDGGIIVIDVDNATEADS